MDRGKVTKTFSIDEEVYTQFKLLCVKQGKYVSAEVQRMMERELTKGDENEEV